MSYGPRQGQVTGQKDYSYAPSTRWQNLFLKKLSHLFREITKRERCHQIVHTNNSIILRLNHSKLTHFRRRQRHINYDSDVVATGGQKGSEPEPEPALVVGQQQQTPQFPSSFFCHFIIPLQRVF